MKEYNFESRSDFLKFTEEIKKQTLESLHDFENNRKDFLKFWPKINKKIYEDVENDLKSIIIILNTLQEKIRKS